MRVALKSGAYSARSVIANAQRCVNLYAEKNPEDAPVPYTYYPTPGLRTLSSPPFAGPGRGLYRASNGVLYAAVGRRLYSLSTGWGWTLVGAITAGLSTPVSMADNGTTMILVDGSGAGFTVHMGTGAFGTISQAAFYGADRIDFLDTFFLLNRPGTGQFYSSLSNSTTFDPLYFATKIGYADKLVSIAVVHRELLLLGSDTSENWVNSGGANFPFEIMNGVFMQHGCMAKYSVALMGDEAFFLGQDKVGSGVVFSAGGYQAKPISTFAMAAAIASYGDVSDAVGYCYQQGQHQFYQISFPGADKTWCYDISTGQWDERPWIDANGVEHRHRAQCQAAAYGANVVLDWQTGDLYALDPDTYTDAGAPIVRRRGFPHMIGDGNRVGYRQFIADMEVGRATAAAGDPKIYLRWSDDHGVTWGNPIAATLGRTGDTLQSIQYQRLGFARDRVFELFWSAPVRTALNGAFIEAKMFGS